MNIFFIAVGTVVVAACLALVALVMSQRQTRSQLAALMTRLDGLERLASTDESVRRQATDLGDTDVGQGAADQTNVNLSRDVLAGRTSFVRRAVEGKLSRPASLAGQVIALGHSRIGDSLSPAELAAELAVSLRTLERGLAAELGCTPRQLIMAMKMREARRLLMSGRFRVNEVATRLGFATASHFSRTFRTFYREPPSQLARPAKS